MGWTLHRQARGLGSGVDLGTFSRVHPWSTGRDRIALEVEEPGRDFAVPVPSASYPVTGLYRHQEEGARWLARRRAGLLADEQGLGKTITAIAAADRLGVSRFLVVSPTVVLWNWKEEVETWSPLHKVQVLDRGDAKLDRSASVYVISHGLLLRAALLDQLASWYWPLVILDESHFFKNPEAKRVARFYKDVVPVAERVWLLSGTPCPNHVGELWVPLRGLSPSRVAVDGQTLSYEKFLARYCDLRSTPYGLKPVGNKRDLLPDLKKRIKGFVLRRKADDVLDLPPLRFETIQLTPPPDHRFPAELHEAAERARARMEKDGLDPVENPAEFADALSLARADTDLARFRRLCGLAKIEPVVELLAMELFGMVKTGGGSGGREKPQGRGSVAKIVVFAHHKDVVREIAHGLRTFGKWGKNPAPLVLTITGDSSARYRENAIKTFQHDPKCRAIVCNIVAGGTGATLTAATEVFFAETSYVPGENAQAAKRCHRIGQTKPVRVRFAALGGTVDSAISKALATKARMISEALDA